jgi:guanylate kinase
LNNGTSSYEPLVFVISAPSGSGKSTLVGKLMETVPGLNFSVSFTTREARGVERSGINYNYISRKEFEERIARGEFLEWASVFGNYYGTHISVLEKARRDHTDVVLDIDVQGARQLKLRIPDAISIFILAPSREELEQRLRSRSEDTQSVIDRRLREAAEEIRNYDRYDYVIVNQQVEESAALLSAIVQAERACRRAPEGCLDAAHDHARAVAATARRAAMEDRVKPILATFEIQKSEV